MARKKFAEIVNAESGRIAKLYHDAEWGEFRVVFYKGTIKQAGADYHASDRSDAIDTANHWTNQKD